MYAGSSDHMMHHGVKVEFVRPFQQLFHPPSVMACLGEYSLHQLSIEQCHACCIHQHAVPSMPCLTCYTLSNSSLDATVPTPSLDHANPIVCSTLCSSPLLMQVRCCQNSNQSKISTDAMLSAWCGGLCQGLQPAYFGFVLGCW